MEEDRRHALEANDLAGTTLELVDRIRPHLRTILAAVGLLFAGLAAWTVIAAQQAAAKARSWESCIAAISSGDAAGLETVLRQYGDSPAAGWAQLELANAALAEGCDLLFTDRARGLTRLEDAVGRFRQLLASRPTGMLAERTVFGLAKANEALGNLDEARKGYEAVIADHPGSAAAQLAAARVAAVSREATRQWYDWFAAQKPAPPAAPAAGGQAATPDAPSADAAPAATAAEPAAPAAGK
jgi:predicted negative regulator of RcsB-dependent stress response